MTQLLEIRGGVKRFYMIKTSSKPVLHSTVGPAVEYPNGKCEYWLCGKKVSKNVVDSLGTLVFIKDGSLEWK